MNKIDATTIRNATGFDLKVGEYDSLGVADGSYNGRVLTFLDNPKYGQKIGQNKSIKGVFVKLEDADLLSPELEKIIVDDPRWFFFSIVNYLGRTRLREKSRISGKAKIHPSVVIADEGVVIEDDVVIEPGAVILSDVTLRVGVVVRAGAVIGSDGYEHKRTTKGILTVVHDGEVIVEKHAEVGPNTFVAKGFAYRPTIVGEETKIDALVHYAHGVQSGKRCFIVANSMIGGNVSMGDDVWVGPSVAIANRINIGSRAFLTFGSVVTRDILEDEKVTGNFAIPHAVFLRNLKRSIKDD